tara:strand:- start:159 stop:497 length:339 start_codon:yes stop_codon:yes gene_type:complete
MMQTYPMPKKRKFRFDRRLHNKTRSDEKRYHVRRNHRLANSPTHERTPESEKTYNSRGFSNPVEPHPHKGTVQMRRFGRKINQKRMKRMKNGPLLNNWKKYPTERWRNNDTP